MDEKIVVFSRVEDHHDWHSYDDDVSLCGGGLDKFLAIPDGVKEMHAVFTVDEPALGVDYFDVEYGALGTERSIDFYENTISFLQDLHGEGYRYLTVRYNA